MRSNHSGIYFDFAVNPSNRMPLKMGVLNVSAHTLTPGHVVVIHLATTGGAHTQVSGDFLTVTYHFPPLGIAHASIEPGAIGKITYAGYVTNALVRGTVVKGDYLNAFWGAGFDGVMLASTYHQRVSIAIAMTATVGTARQQIPAFMVPWAI